MAQRANVLRSYRELIDLIKRLPTERREASLQEARAAVKANMNESDPLKASDMLKDLVARVSFLRMATPKTYRDRCVHPGRLALLSGCYHLSKCNQQFFAVCRRTRHGAETYVLRDGQLVEGQGVVDSR